MIVNFGPAGWPAIADIYNIYNVEPTCCMKCIVYYIQEVSGDVGDVRCGTYLLHEMY